MYWSKVIHNLEMEEEESRSKMKRLITIEKLN